MNNSSMISAFVILCAAVASAAEPAATALVTVDVGREIGAIKPMNAVNNGPSVKKPNHDQVRGNFETYKAACIPFARTHDSIGCVSGGAHTCDISAIFPNFDADENDPGNSNGRIVSLPIAATSRCRLISSRGTAMQGSQARWPPNANG